MTANRGPGVAVNAGVGTTTLEHRLQLAGQYAENAPGVPRSGVLSQAAAQLVTAKATMAYDIGPAPLVINRTAAEGVYTPTLTGTTTVTTTAAPASNSRWDLVYVKQNDTAKGDADNLAVVGVVQGVSGASPTKPYGTVPTGAYVLAEAQVFSGTTGTSGGANTIAQVWRHTASRGAPVSVRNVAERAEITSPALGQQVARLDLPGIPVETWDGTVWTQISGLRHAEFTGPAFATTGGSGVTWGGPSAGAFTADAGKTVNNSFVQVDAGGRLKILQTGVYATSGVILPTGVPGSYSMTIQDLTGAAVLGVSSGLGYGDKEQSVEAPNAYLVAGTVIEFRLVTSNSITLGSRVRVTKVQ